MMTTEETCVFCSIIAGRAAASIVHADDANLAFLDLRPLVPGHTLVVPKAHIPDLASLPPNQAAQLMHLGQRIAAALRRSALRCEGINLFLADGVAAGQEVMHAHLHVIPRHAQDGFRLQFPPDYATQPRQVLDQQASLIRHALAHKPVQEEPNHA